MFNILVVEDNDLQRQNLIKMLNELNKSFNIYEAASKEEGIRMANTYDIDLFYIDINLKNSSGLDLALKIREYPQYKLTWIIFITTHVKYMLEAFKEVHCYDYLIKPYDKKVVQEITLTVLDNFETKSSTNKAERKYVVFDIKDLNVKVYVDEIVFISVYIRTTYVFTTRGKYSLSKMPFKNVMDMVGDKLVQCHRSYAVNMMYVEKIDTSTPSWEIYYEKFNESVPIGEKFKKDVLEAFKGKP